MLHPSISHAVRYPPAAITKPSSQSPALRAGARKRGRSAGQGPAGGTPPRRRAAPGSAACSCAPRARPEAAQQLLAPRSPSGAAPAGFKGSQIRIQHEGLKVHRSAPLSPAMQYPPVQRYAFKGGSARAPLSLQRNACRARSETRQTQRWTAREGPR